MEAKEHTELRAELSLGYVGDGQTLKCLHSAGTFFLKRLRNLQHVFDVLGSNLFDRLAAVHGLACVRALRRPGAAGLSGVAAVLSLSCVESITAGVACLGRGRGRVLVGTGRPRRTLSFLWRDG